MSSTDAFVVFDLDDAPATGVTRLAKKVLVDGAELLARSTTYSFASFGIRMGGASAGINVEGDGRDDAVAAFVGEAAELVAAGRWTTDPSVGLSETDLAPLRSSDPRPSELWDGVAADLTGRGAVAAAGAARPGGLSGATAVVVGGGPIADAARAALGAHGAAVTDGGIDTECDVVFLAGKAGMLDHDGASTVRARFVVPLTAVPVTARAHAVLAAAGIVHVPDFLSTAAPLVQAYGGEASGDPVGAVAAKTAEFAGEGTGMWMAAVTAAEAFLSTWRDSLPFGRPLA